MQTSGRKALNARRTSQGLDVEVSPNSVLTSKILEIKQLQRNKTILSVLTTLSDYFRGSGEVFVATIRLNEQGHILIYLKPTRCHLFPGRVTFMKGENLVYRWVCSQNEIRLCYYTNEIVKAQTSIQGNLLLRACKYHPKKDSPIIL